MTATSTDITLTITPSNSNIGTYIVRVKFYLTAIPTIFNE